tara:strand:- start:1751 stop:2449 length:699 start_codon:yes stop_codon:yes gene_type:complete
MNDQLRKIPNHVAIIMDGNGRWAKAKGKNRIYGHNNAKKAIRESIELCGELGVKYLSLFTFSTENWNRPSIETKALIKLIEKVMSNELNELIKKNVKIKVIGDLSKFSLTTKNTFLDGIKKTKNNNGLNLVLAINYSGKWDIINAVKKIKTQEKDYEKLKNKFESYLSTNDIPDPELVIRSGGEKRISNFYLWQAAYSEFIFTDIFWPDFRKRNLNNAIFEFQKRKRRFGGL